MSLSVDLCKFAASVYLMAARYPDSGKELVPADPTGHAPSTAATSSAQGMIPAVVASALIAKMSVDPGTTVPITGTASDSASRKTARNDSCGCAHVVDQDHLIIGETRVLDVGVLAVMRGLLRPLQHPIHLGEVEIAEQRRDHTALVAKSERPVHPAE